NNSLVLFERTFALRQGFQPLSDYRFNEPNQLIFSNSPIAAAKCANVQSKIPKFQLSGDR
ncbi:MULTISPECIES: hypothetical protein, partial [unclassified Microcoleus]|uniref:hypothetical protein n=1 Tax=unclassified Microcoleus TaxID=2642155 RepID=UPI002FCEBBCE